MYTMEYIYDIVVKYLGSLLAFLLIDKYDKTNDIDTTEQSRNVFEIFETVDK